MPTYNFTVRAIDDKGAYADQPFSITVKNTKIERFVAVEENGNIFTSQDGIAWTYRQGVSCRDIQYGGGSWIGSDLTSYLLKYWWSPDGIVWTKLSYPGTGGSYANSTYTNNVPTWSNGKWYFHSQDGKLYTSTDGKTWTANATAITGLSSAGTMKLISNGTRLVQFCRLQNSSSNSTDLPTVANLTAIQSASETDMIFSNLSTFTYQASDALYYNGLWLISDEYNRRILYSYNLTNWQVATGTSYTTGAPQVVNLLTRPGKFAVGNGVILCSTETDRPYYAMSDFIFKSTNGREWTSISMPTQTHKTTAYYSNQYQYGGHVAFANGTFVYANGTSTNSTFPGLAYSNNNGTTWSKATSNVYTNGYFIGVAARNE